uniref:Aspartic peptidase DDI1-type domain-containing protein n=1 Tax=Fagus sylvatica TaxID=28930 RepID=A0A2N9FCZ4_FAGSY
MKYRIILTYSFDILQLQGAPKANEKSKETPAEKDESGIAKSNDTEKCPFPAPFPQALKLPKNLDLTCEILEHLHQLKRKHHVKKTAFLIEHVSAIIQHKVPPKYKDPGCPTISCTIGDYMIERALLDLGASVNLLSFSVYLQLGLGRPFLATANALINCRNGRMKITFGSMTAELNIFNVNPEQLVDEECEYVNLIEAAPQEDSKGVDLHVATMKSARGRNYSFGGSRLEG